ncbi:MAG: hypothetical protein KBG15_01485 [Kofleriaceae bacterium]|nr:hypothetical protein [Kofleriaceae bacterium]
MRVRKAAVPRKPSAKIGTARLTMGIDEAGRGPAIGPLVMAAVVLDTRAAAALTRAGLTDSKAFGAGAKAHAMRHTIAALVRERAIWTTVRVVEAAVVDTRVLRNELNALEREVAVTMIVAAPPCQRIIADGARMFAPLVASYPQLEPRDRAESLHAAVAAASVLAKTARDDWYAAFCARFAPEFGEIAGGGYVNDATRRFLRAFATKYGALPDEVRLSWPHPYVEDLLDLTALKQQRLGTVATAARQMALWT